MPCCVLVRASIQLASSATASQAILCHQALFNTMFYTILRTRAGIDEMECLYTCQYILLDTFCFAVLFLIRKGFTKPSTKLNVSFVLVSG